MQTIEESDEKLKEENAKKLESEKYALYSYIIYKLQEVTMKKLEEINAVELFNKRDMATVKVLANKKWNRMYADDEDLNKL